jgi:hypothetical protein
VIFDETKRKEQGIIVSENIRPPNGIDLLKGDDGPPLWVTLTQENKIVGIDPRPEKKQQAVTISLPGDKGNFRQPWPDGLLVMENGDLLVAAFGTGEILYLEKGKGGYEQPITVANVPGCPTDLVLAPSLSGEGISLYVTYTQLWNFVNWSLQRGAVAEIQNIDRKLHRLGRQ